MFSKLMAFVLLLICYTGHAQHRDTIKHLIIDTASLTKGLEETKNLNASIDSSMNRQLDRMRQEAHATDSANMVRTMDEFMREKAERDAKMVKELWFKGSLFAFMLAATIFGYIRRRKLKKKGDSSNQPV